MAKIFDEKITKHQDWGGDESTGNLPVAGNRVQEFIKDQLDSKAGVFHYDNTNNRYIVFADEESQDTYFEDPTRTDLIIGTFDAPFNYSAQITMSSPTYVAILAGAKNNYIEFTFDTTNKQGQSVGEDVMCTFTFIKGSNKKVVTEKYRYGQSVRFKVDEYISTGTNNVVIGIVGQNTLAAITVGVTYQVVDLKLSDTYDVSQAYNIVTNPQAAAAIPYSVSGYGTKIMEWYLDGVILDYIKVEDEIVDVSTTRTKYISLANLSQGSHSLQYRVYTIINGEKFYSDTIYHDLLVVTGANKEPIIGVSAIIPMGNDIITSGNLPLYGITQYIPYELHFAVFNPSNAAYTDTVIAVDGKQSAKLQAHNGELSVYSFRADEYGVKTLTITAGTTVYTIGLNISKSSINLAPITEGLQLDLSALGKSNNDANREEWVYGMYSTTFKGFNWNKASGWNNNRLIISSGAYIDVNISPLSPDPTNLGRTLEFELSTTNVQDDNAVICDLRNEAGTGLLITASEATLVSAGGSKVGTKFKSGENIRISFVINKKIGAVNKGLVFIYINGELSGAVDYAPTDNFTVPKLLRIGETTEADVHLKSLRFYNSVLSLDQVLDNYILYRDTTNEMLSLYERNDVYEPNTTTMSVDKLAGQCPVFIFTGDIPTLENTTDKNKTIYVDVEYINIQDPSKSFIGIAIRLRPQGTSSMGYPKKNFRPYTGYGITYDSLGKVMMDGLYAFANRAQPVNVWCLKADYAESSGTHNTGIARLWNQVLYDAQINGEYKLRTGAQKAAIAAGYPYDVRTTVDGFPVNVFYRLTPDSDLVYIGKYNFNNDKSTESVFGFKDIPGFDNSRMQCWEVLNNGNHLALFQDMDNFDSEWEDAYEARYPDKSENVTDLKSFSEWVVSTKDNIEKFKTEKWDHLDVYKTAGYYIYYMRHGAVDQIIKNTMLTSEDGIHWYFIKYDNDSIHGLRNDGPLVYSYDIDRQTIDTSFSALVYAYAGHESTLWNNLEADEEFMRIVSEVDNALYMAGLTYEKAIDMFDNQQAGKWCERIYNQDAQYKYLNPFTDSGINNLFMLQGSRKAHRRWWLSHRFDLMDSKFVSGAYKAKSIEWKAANAPTGIEFSITAGSKLYYGYGLNNVPIEFGVKLERGESHTFTTKQVINVGDPVRLYSAINIQELDIHNFIPYLSTLNISEVFNETVGTKFKKLIMGVDTTTDDRRNTSLSIISGLTQAQQLEYLDISGYKAITNLDLSSLLYFKTLKAYESGLAGLALANGSPISYMELPDSMQAISFDSLPNLTGDGFKIVNFGRNLTTISIKNCEKWDYKEFIQNWFNNKLSGNLYCTLILSGIKWKEVLPEFLIALGGIKTDGGTLSLKGRIELSRATMTQVEQLKQIYGAECTNPASELYIKAPDGVFLTGPTSVVEGRSAQYDCSVFAEFIGKIEFWIMNGNSEVSSYNGASIDKDTGLLTTTETGSARSITIRGKHTPPQGPVINDDLVVAINKANYPTSLELSGATLINKIGNSEYKLKVLSTGEVTGNYNVVYSLSGSGASAAQVGSSSKEGCILNVTNLIPGSTFTLKAETKKVSNNAVTASTSITIAMELEGVIMTSVSNPEVMAICKAAGWAANAGYMLQTEAEAVTDIGTRFKSSSIKHFDEFKYFTGVTSLEERAFYSCAKLTSIILPDSITKLGSSVFNSCTLLISVNIPSGLTYLGSSMFSNCNSLASITIPDNITKIERFVFERCKLITSIYIPRSVINISPQAFGEMVNLTSLEVDGNNAEYVSVDNILYDKSISTLHTCAGGKEGGLTVPDSVKIIGEYAFNYCEKLTSVVLPDVLTSIGGYAFSFSGITSLVIPDSVVNIGMRPFYLCRKLTSVTLPKNMVAIPMYMFEASAISSIEIPDSVVSIGGGAFSSCGITSIKIPSKITSIEPNTFKGCQALTSIKIPEGVTIIKDSAFAECSSLNSIELPESLETLEDSVFEYCKNCATIISHKTKAPITKTSYLSTPFGRTDGYGGSNTGISVKDKGNNIFYVPAGATGYESSVWKSVLLEPTLCGFTISYTL